MPSSDQRVGCKKRPCLCQLGSEHHHRHGLPLAPLEPLLMVLTSKLHRRIEACLNSSKEIIVFAANRYFDFSRTKSILN